MKEHRRSANERPLAKFAVCRSEAAALLDISTGTFDDWIRRGWMPRGVKLGSLRRWDAAEVRSAWLGLLERHRDAVEEEDERDNPFNQTVG